MIKKIILSIVATFITLTLFSTFYIQYIDQQSVILRLSTINRTETVAGIHFKIPIIESRFIFTKRVIPYDAPPFSVITKDKKTILFDTVAFYIITDPSKFYIKFKTEEGAQQWLDDVAYSAVRNQAGKFAFDELLAKQRDTILLNAANYINKYTDTYGVKIIDIQLKRVSLPKTNEEAVYRSMIADRNQNAAQINAEGEAKYKEVTSNTDMIYVTKISEAQKEAAEIKGKADKRAQDLINMSMREAPDLYVFIKKLEFYKKVIPNTPIIIKPTGVLSDIRGPIK